MSEMPKEIWMHIGAKTNALSCHFRAIDTSSVLFFPAVRALNAETRIRDLEADCKEARDQWGATLAQLEASLERYAQNPPWDLVQQLEAALRELRTYCEEIWRQHRDKDDEGYNECEIDECAWCSETKKLTAPQSETSAQKPGVTHD